MINVYGSQYSAPVKGEQSLTYSTLSGATADLRFASADRESIDLLLNISPKDIVLAPGQGVRMIIDRPTGIFRGVLKPTGGGARKLPFSGVLLQSRNRGEGLSGRGSASGAVTLLPR